MKKKSIQISEKHNTGEDEWWCDWYSCPNCKPQYGHITTNFKFCPDCGIKLRWKKEVEEEYD